MSTRRDLLRGVLEYPEDPDRRLIYADYLEDEGEDRRAEFIRVEIRDDCTQTFHSKFHSCRYKNQWHCSICKHLHRLMGCKEAKAPSPRRFARFMGLTLRNLLPVRQSVDLSYRRAGSDGKYGHQMFTHNGFVTAVRTSLDNFLAMAQELFEQHPVTEVMLSDRRPLYLPAVLGTRRVRSAYGWQYYFSKHDDTVCYVLPEQLLDESSPRPVDFPDWTATQAWLSSLCVNYGRCLAGLPPLDNPIWKPLRVLTPWQWLTVS
jgi:uncharacterized protein (TIGR02996 family)